ncbi:MAG: ATP-dependent helicase [Gammaproteobacteria bacterium]|nr:ATP-dependent helicase [Gammaproteobacteria bacterium]
MRRITPEQQAVIDHASGHARVSAVAGSGKTTTLILRIVELLRRGVDPRRIRVLMFNKSAQEEFAARLANELPVGTALPKVQTFHSLALRVCQTLEQRGFLEPMRLETSEGVLGMISAQALQKAGGWQARNDAQEDFLTYLGFVKSGFARPGEVETRYFDTAFDFPANEAFRVFEAERQRRRIRFFDDLLFDAVNVLRENPGANALLADHLDHVIVDEYQDINEVQQFLLKILAGKRADVMAVGDVDQCIYEWRGARPDYMTHGFDSDFPDATRYPLSRTFRFGHGVSLLANHSIRFNRERDNMLCISAESCPATEFAVYPTSRSHAAIADIVRAAREQGRKFRDIAILLRLYAMSLSAEIGLLANDIPYRLAGGRTALDRDELRGVMAYMALAAGRLPSGDRASDEASILAMLNLPSIGLRRMDVERLARRIAIDPKRAADQLEEAAEADEVSRPVRRKLRDRATAWRQLDEAPTSTLATQVIRLLRNELDLAEGFRFSSQRAETAYDKELLVDTLEALAAEGNFSAGDFIAYMEDLRERVRENAERDDAVLLTSIHRAKGLEWPVVVLPSLVEGQFPFHSDRKRLDRAREEAERRLFYVGITRAREQLHLLAPRDDSLDRHIRDNIGMPRGVPVRGEASRFLLEAAPGLSTAAADGLQAEVSETVRGEGVGLLRDYVAAINAGLEIVEKGTPGAVADGRALYDSAGRLAHGSVGMTVFHAEHGRGRIDDILPGKGPGGRTQLRVRFSAGVFDMGPEHGLSA